MRSCAATGLPGDLSVLYLLFLALPDLRTTQADPECIAETYLQLHRQHRSTWAF
jgi:hypothetical protein